MRVERAFNPDGSMGKSAESVATTTSMASTTAGKALGDDIKKEFKVIKSGTLQGGFLPFKKKGESMYVVLAERAIEIWESEKAFQKKRGSKYMIDLAISFNVHNEHFHPKLKHCVCVMQPDTTLLLKSESDELNREWYDAILQTTICARAAKLLRPCSAFEFFEAVYDVEIVETPKKLKIRGMSESGSPNIIDRFPYLSGSRRLCFYAHTIFLCSRNIEPGREDEIGPTGIPPFHPKDAVEIERKFVPNFGLVNSYFVIVMGRGSPMGNCELWAECESEKVAEQVHHTLNGIIAREGEKRNQILNGTQRLAQETLPVPQLPRAHRQRSHTQPHRPRLTSQADILASVAQRNANSPLAALANRTSTGLDKCFAKEAQSQNQPTKHGEPSSSNGMPLPLPGQRHSFAAPSDAKGRLLPLGGVPHASIFPVRRQSETIKEQAEEAANYQPMDPKDETKKMEWEQMMRGEMKGVRPPSPSSTMRSEETEDSGGTLKCFGGDSAEGSGGTLRMDGDIRSKTPPPGSIRNLSMMELGPKPFVPIQSKADHLSSSEDDADADADVISAGTNTSTGGESVSAGEDYAHMEIANWTGDTGNLSVPLYKLNNRSYLSSSDSCYSSMAEKAQRVEPLGPLLSQDGQQSQFRTYSFGPGHPQYHRPSDMPSPASQDRGIKLSSDAVSSPSGTKSSLASSNGDAALMAGAAAAGAKEDPRKRAFSLGSKNFFANFSKPFRKVSSRARQAGTSASGASLASSTVSSGPPPSSASSNHIATIGHPVDDPYRNRSGSFGSGRSTPYSRRSGQHDTSHDHLEMDFGNGPNSTVTHGLGGRCGSGSMGSVDSPSRSRTSSFGANVKRDDHDENGGLTPSQILLAKAKQLSMEAEAAAAAKGPSDDPDYVLTEAPAKSAEATSPRGYQPPPMSLSTAHGHHIHHAHHHSLHHHSPEHAMPPGSMSSMPPPAVQHNYSGLVLDVMGKAHDSRSSQYFETIEENTSGRSSRASSIDGDSQTMTEERSHRRELLEEDDDYAPMDLSSVQQQPEPAAAAAATTPVAEVQRQLQPHDASSKGSRSRSTSPSVSSTRRVESSSTLKSLTSSACDRETKEASPAAAAAPAAVATELKLQLPQRQKMSTQSEGVSSSLLLGAPAGLPKRSSVPVLKDHAREEGGQGDGQAGTASLNYACLQLNGDSTPHDSRSRSKSGILFSGREAAAAAASPAASDPAATAVEYTVVKPVS